MVYALPLNVDPVARKTEPNPKEQNIYQSLKFLVIFAQILGILPQNNVGTTYTEMFFKWTNWKTLYTLLGILNLSFLVTIWVLAWFEEEYSFGN